MDTSLTGVALTTLFCQALHYEPNCGRHRGWRFELTSFRLWQLLCPDMALRSLRSPQMTVSFSCMAAPLVAMLTACDGGVIDAGQPLNDEPPQFKAVGGLRRGWNQRV
jgi:hypothetical protein